VSEVHERPHRKRGERSWAAAVDVGHDLRTSKRRQKWIQVTCGTDLLEAEGVMLREVRVEVMRIFEETREEAGPASHYEY
jgi:hypothetical protein